MDAPLHTVGASRLSMLHAAPGGIVSGGDGPDPEGGLGGENGGGDGAPSPPAGYTALGPYPTDRALGEAALVLRSMQVPHASTYAAGGGFLIVRDADYDRARTQLDRYEEENRDFPPVHRPERQRYTGAPLVAIAFIALVAFAWVTGPVARAQGPWFREGASVASLVLSSEPFRAVTALTLHADGAHVLSNLVSGAIFGRAVERRFGPGVALLSLVAAGTLGNVANALFYASEGIEHRSIGASTAVFGAVGLLAASQLVFGVRRTHATPASPLTRRPLLELVAPVVGALALLGALGASPQTDIMAHAFGLLAGLVLGVPVAFAVKRWHRSYVWRRPQIAAQILAGAAGLAIVGSSWALALA